MQGESTGNQKLCSRSKVRLLIQLTVREDGTLEFWIRNNGSNNVTARMNENGILLTDGMTLKYEGATNDPNETTLTVEDPTPDRTITLTDATGTASLIDNTETLTNKTLTSPTITSPTITGGTFSGTFTGTMDATGMVFGANPLYLKVSR